MSGTQRGKRRKVDGAPRGASALRGSRAVGERQKSVLRFRQSAGHSRGASFKGTPKSLTSSSAAHVFLPSAYGCDAPGVACGSEYACLRGQCHGRAPWSRGRTKVTAHLVAERPHGATALAPRTAFFRGDEPQCDIQKSPCTSRRIVIIIASIFGPVSECSNDPDHENAVVSSKR